VAKGKYGVPKDGDYPVICDMCGFRRWASECRLNYKGELVCADTCWEPQHPRETQRFVRSRPVVRIRRPEPTDRFLEYGEITADDL